MDKQLRNALKGLAADDLGRRRRAMEPFVRATFVPFSRCLYRYLGNEVECEDVLEDVYADIWENPDRITDVTTEQQLVHTAYLYYMRKHLREVYRRLNRHAAQAQTDLTDLMAPEEGVLEGICDKEMRQLLQQALGQLKPRERRALELWTEGMSHRGIASELNTTVGAVKMLLYRTVLKLREIMKPDGQEM